MKLKSIIKKRGWLAALYLLGFLIVMGIVAETQPWGRGWVHDLKYYISQQNTSFSFPDDNSSEMNELQRKVDEWYPQILEQYPKFKVEFKSVPDDENGFLKIIEWQEELRFDGEKAAFMQLPNDISDISEILFSSKKTNPFRPSKLAQL